MYEEILSSIKLKLGIPVEHTEFDKQILSEINATFITLHQLGAGPEDGFVVEDNFTLWKDYSTNNMLVSAVKEYVYLKVRLIFDPPASSSAVDSINNVIKELEFRINIALD